MWDGEAHAAPQFRVERNIEIMKRNFIEIMVAILLGVVAFYLYAAFLGVVASYTYLHAFKFLKYIPHETRNLAFWSAVLTHDAIASVPVFLVIGVMLGFALKRYHWNRPIILFVSFVSSQFFYLYVIAKIGLASAYYIETLRLMPPLIMITIFSKIGHKVKLNRFNNV